MIIRSLGHSCFTAGDGQTTVLFDPFLTGNPDAVVEADGVTADAILVSHGHPDHLGDAVAIAQRLGVPIVAAFELAMYCQRQGAEVIPMHIGGAADLPFGRVKLTPAWHGSAVMTEEGAEYTGLACGFLVTLSGQTVYFAGDTGLFSDMALIARWAPIDVAILPIGDHFTMGIADALTATELLRPRVVIPMHYSAFEPIRKDPADFARQAEGMGVRCVVLRPGEQVEVGAQDGRVRV